MTVTRPQLDDRDVVGISKSTRGQWPQKLDLFGVGVSKTTYEEATEAIISAAQDQRSGLVSCYAVHALMSFQESKELREVSNAFDLVTPDGQPVRWALNLLHNTGLPDRVYGPELMLRTCEAAAAEQIPIYLYGGTDEVLPKLEENIASKYPRLQIVGSESPPFRELTPAEDAEVIARIKASGARIVFIGLGCPKQDLFAFAHRDSIDAVQICVGAAFDFHAGVKQTAPVWMQRHGLEWLFRLGSEPRRLWRRYLTTNSRYLLCLGLSLLNTPKVLSQRAAQDPRGRGPCELAHTT